MTTTEAAPFGDLVRRYRRAAGLTQEELAERAGLSVRAISDIERGVKHRPRQETVKLLADALSLKGEDRSAFEAARQRIGEEATPAEGPPVLPPTNLPDDPTPFIGREREIAEV